MKIKISATFEGNCMLCHDDKLVFSAGDEDTKKVVTICQDCATGLGNTQTSDVIEKYGKGDEKAFSGSGIEIQGLDKVQQKLKEKRAKAERTSKPRSARRSKAVRPHR